MGIFKQAHAQLWKKVRKKKRKKLQPVLGQVGKTNIRPPEAVETLSPISNQSNYTDGGQIGKKDQRQSWWLGGRHVKGRSVGRLHLSLSKLCQFIKRKTNRTGGNFNKTCLSPIWQLDPNKEKRHWEKLCFLIQRERERDIIQILNFLKLNLEINPAYFFFY